MPYIGNQPAVASGTLSTEGDSGSINFTQQNKTIFIENDSRIDQDVTADSTPTFNNLKLSDGGEIQEAGGTSAITIDASGEVVKLGQDTPTGGEVLGWDGANLKAVWQPAFTGTSKFYGFRIDDFSGSLFIDTGNEIGSTNIVEFDVTVYMDYTNHTYGKSRFKIEGRDPETLILMNFKMVAGASYRFLQSDSSNSSHPLAFSESLDGTTYNPNNAVTTSGSAGSTGAYTQIDVPLDAPDKLYFKCGSHTGMGGVINIVGNIGQTFDADETNASNEKPYIQQYFDTSGVTHSINSSGHLIVTI